MSTSYLSDQDQIQLIKKWCRDNGLFTLAMILAVLLLSYGWRYWQESRERNSDTASIIYEQLLSDVANQQQANFLNAATKLTTDYSYTPYASLAALIWAQTAVKDNNLNTAINQLQWVIDHSRSHELKQIARIRLARVLLAQGKYQAALASLSTVEVTNYSSLMNEVKGDIYLAQGKRLEASAAYQNALKTLPNSEPNRIFLQMKYDQLHKSE
jgi:predicted negative regulator of RcsB-dependent stress response